MSYPIISAKRSRYIDDIYISTDSVDIKRIGLKYGAKYGQKYGEKFKINVMSFRKYEMET